MAVPKRHAKLSGTYFITSRTWESRALFVKDAVCQVLVQTLLRYRRDGAYQLHAFVLMPEHFHILLTPSAGTTLERAVQYIKGGSSHEIGKGLRFRFPVWQPGFSDHRIRDAKDYEIHLRYIEQNPVRRRLAAAAGDYPWSSASGKFKLDEPPQRLKPASVATPLRHG
jgi:putative transposase